MGRRALVAAMACGVLAASVFASAQQPADVRRIGILTAGNASDVAAVLNERLRELGWIEGRNLIIEQRGAGGKAERVPALAEELVALRVAVIVSAGAVASLAAKKATTTIPIVFRVGGDPIQLGLVASLNLPGGNVTGVSFLQTTTTGIMVQMLHEAAPNAAVLGLLINPSTNNSIGRHG